MADTPPPPPPRLSPARVRALQRRILAWYAVNGRDLPWRHTTDPYAILVSEIMLQQTQVSRVVPAFAAWMARYPRLEELAAAPLDDVLRRWQGLGYNNRARRLRECAVATVSDRRAGPHDGRAGDREMRATTPAALPHTLDRLRALPGIGPYTARAVLVFAHNADLAAVDANVRRVLLHELRLPPDTGARHVQAVADAVLPRGRSRDWHNALMDYGALVLTARRTGIPSLSRQGRFEGSRRQHRARLLRLLLSGGPAATAELAASLNLEIDAAAEIVALLERDGLVRRDGDLIVVA